ncbi:MAG: tetratricopeptide repeat protein, partial [Planctomicrobium sp.]|nr:tetratricopeptide repeat protein [Planctomicrobium sp.]
MSSISNLLLKSVFAAIFAVLCINHGVAADAKLPPSPELPQRISPFEGLTDPLTGESLSTFTPKHSGSVSEKRKSAALAQYMTGRINSERKRFPKALAAFEKAIEL